MNPCRDLLGEMRNRVNSGGNSVRPSPSGHEIVESVIQRTECKRHA
jgi:hypothetical protein